MDADTEELRVAHDVLAEVYADILAGVLERMRCNSNDLLTFDRTSATVDT